MEEQETLHLEADIGIDDDSQSVDPVRGGSRSRYSMTKPFLTMPDEILGQKSTMSLDGIWPTRRAPTSSCPGSAPGDSGIGPALNRSLTSRGTVRLPDS